MGAHLGLWYEHSRNGAGKRQTTLMLKFLRHYLTTCLGFAAIAVAAPAAAQGDCSKPAVPSLVVDASTATQQDLAEAFKSVKKFERDSAVYRECLQNVTLAGGPDELAQLTSSSEDEVRALQTKFKALVAALQNQSAS